ncbi:MAG: DNA polymerase III subunit chi [Alphaproteobacteria bacterium]|nr:DNA polymerase III subunit chi [Alphaproteobacteria bacterium]
MRVDFYQFSRDPAEKVVPLLARNTMNAGEKLLVVSGDAAQLDRIGQALWEPHESFLAHGRAGQPHEARQPILLSDCAEPTNGARFLALADGVWREADGRFERTFLLFGKATLEAARDCWRRLGQREGLERHFWKQEGGRWIEAG